MIVYFNGQYLSKEDVRISPDDRGFLFADGTYEVIRLYDGNPFRAEDHYERLRRSLRSLRIEGVEPNDFADVIARLVDENDIQDGSVYIQVTRGAAPRKHTFPPDGTSPTVYAALSPAGAYEDRWKQGVAVILVPETRWARCDIKSIGLPANVLASQRALEAEAEEAIFVRDGVCTEGSHTNFAAVYDGTFVTAPRGNYILPGVTRTVVLELCDELGIPYREEPIFEHELDQAEELMILGTSTEVMPVVQVDGRTVGTGKPGPVTQRLQEAYYRKSRGHDNA